MIYDFVKSLAGKIIMIAVVLIFLLLAFKSCTDGRKAGDQGKQAQKEATAATETAKDVAATVIANASENASLDDLVTATQKEIENATDAKISRAAAVAAICGMHDDSSRPSGC